MLGTNLSTGDFFKFIVRSTGWMVLLAVLSTGDGFSLRIEGMLTRLYWKVLPV